MDKKKIKFGTSGWRGILADDFTLHNVRIVLQAICNYIKGSGLHERPVIIGYDTRFMGEKLADTAVEVLAGNKIKSLLCNRDTPTPVIAYEIIKKNAAGGINFTASHNPPDYNGIKFSPEWGGPALPETTKQIEKEIGRVKESDIMTISLDEADRKGYLKKLDPIISYLNAIKGKVDTTALRKAKIHPAIDTLYGTAAGYIDRFLDEIGANYEIIHNYRDPYFGGNSPEPSEKQLAELISLVKSKKKIKLGLATDGDADRFGIVDGDGGFIQPNTVIALLFDYLIESRGLKGGVARSVATTHFIDAIAEYHGREVYETPVGFKYIGELLTSGKVLIGGEESAGLSIRGHVPEKDGILACLLVAEMVAKKKKSIKELTEELYKKVGRYMTGRVNIRFSERDKERVLEKMGKPVRKFADKTVVKTDRTDGAKFILDDSSWLLMRASGTEPVIRLYVEASSVKELNKIVRAGEIFITGK